MKKKLISPCPRALDFKKKLNYQDNIHDPKDKEKESILKNLKNVMNPLQANEFYNRQMNKQKLIEGFTKKYNVYKLVYYERYDFIEDAIRREKQLKNWRREK